MTALVYAQQQQRNFPASNGIDPHYDLEMDANPQTLHTFFCRALYNYQSNDLSSLAFSKGDIIEVLTQLESGWWDGLLNDERGWFPSNYVTQITDEEAAQELVRKGLLTPVDENNGQSNPWAAEDSSYLQSGMEADPRHTSAASGDFWVPEFTNDGQIYYLNTFTGETSRDLPSDPSETDGAAKTLFPSTSEVNPRQHGSNRSRSNSRATESTSTSREAAGFGIRRRSDTPEPWIKRLADDGMSYFYVHKETGETRWTPPSPTTSTAFGRLRADSDATYDSQRLSVYSDSSDIHPFFAETSATEKVEPKDPSPISEDAIAAEKAARQLQEAMLPATSESFAEQVAATRAAIQRITQPTSEQESLTDLVDEVVQNLRALLYRAGTLVTGIKIHSSSSENEDVINTRLKPLQRKVTATLSKVVLSARAAKFSSSGVQPLPGRVQQDAADLEQTVINFVEEVEHCNLDNLGSKRLTGVLLSGEGAAGVGVGLVGAGVGGGWKGLGFVPMDEAGPQRHLGTSLITEFQDQKAILDEKAQILAAAYSAGSPHKVSVPEIRASSRDFLARVFIFTNTLADTNVAQHVDVDGVLRDLQAPSGGNDPEYIQTIDRARLLVRKLEATTQALYDGGSIFLLAAQSPFEMTQGIIPSVSSLMNHISSSVELIEGLYHVGYEQAKLASGNRGEYDYRRSISGRMSRLNLSEEHLEGFDARQTMGDDLGDLHDGEEDDYVDMAAAFNTSRTANVAAVGAQSFDDESTLSRQSTFIDTASTAFDSAPTESHGTSSRISLGSVDHASMTTITKSNGTYPQNTEITDLLADDESITKRPRGNSKANKIHQFFGTDAPVRGVEDASKPWYLKSDHPAADKMLNPDGTMRAGTLPALIEHLTDHEFRDANFNRTFLLTFKSFTTVEEVVDLLIERFNISPPEEMTEEQHAEWTKKKKDVIQIRVMNVLKQLITEDDVLERDDTEVLTHLRDFAVSVQDVSTPAKLLVTVADRALKGEDTIIKTITHSINSTPPQSILPKGGKKLKLLDIDPTEMARQLTLMESNLYNRIRVMECLSRAKEQKNKNTVQDHIAVMIEHTNQMTMWINQQVLDKDDSKKRAAVIKYFVTVAERCRFLHNYSTMAAMVSSLNTPPIRRLKRTWDQVGQRAMTMLESCERTFDSNKNFSNYRSTLAKITPPCVPFLGVYLTTLVFINEGSKDILPPPPPQPPVAGQSPPPEPSGPLINFAKRQKVAEVIREIKNWQTKPYSLHSVPVITRFIEDALRQCSQADETGDRFWERSLELEPREREDEKMARLLQESGFLM